MITAFLPLYVFCGQQLLVSYLRPSNIDPAKQAWAILVKLVTALRKHWPEVKIILRADSGFCRWKMLRWCESHQVDDIVGVAKNDRLKALSAKLGQRAERKYRKSGEKVRLFRQFKYKADSWDKKRRIIAKAEHTALGANPRFVVSNLVGDAQKLYDQIYCGRGEMENNSWDFSLIAPAVTTGGPTNFGYCSPVAPMSYWKPCVVRASSPPSWLAPKLVPSGSSCSRSAR
jgi:hypothetical protein